jgi:hypothetical protein
MRSVEGHARLVGTNPDAWTRTKTSLIAACGSGRSTSLIAAVPTAWSVTVIAFMGIVSSVIYFLFGGNLAGMEIPFDIYCPRRMGSFRQRMQTV